MQSLQRFGPKALHPLMDALGHRSPQVQEGAATVLGWLKEQGRPAIPVLEGLFGSSDGFVRANAARAIWEISQKADQILPVMLRTLRNEEAKQLHETLVLLADSGPLRIIPVILKIQRDKDVAQLRNTLSLLADMGPLAREAVPDLDRIARSNDVDLAAQAATALWKIAEDRRVAPLRRALKRQRGVLNYHVFRTLAERSLPFPNC